MSEYTFPFRRMTKALFVPVGRTASNFQVPTGFVRKDYTSFLVINANKVWVGLRGTSAAAAGQPAPTTADLVDVDGSDWVFPPGHMGVYSTQYPLFMSAIALAMPGVPLPTTDDFTPLRVYYGNGA